LSLLTHIISGLNSINNKEKIIHRDFHPGNILIEEYEGKPCGYISDFELCQPFYEEVGNQKIYGILPYIAPEVLLGDQYTHTSDVYSFGVIAYKLFSNQHPYD